MADRQGCSRSQIRNRHLLGAGQTGTALAAVVVAEPADPLALQALQRGRLAGVQRAVGRGETGCQLQIPRRFRSDRERLNACDSRNR